MLTRDQIERGYWTVSIPYVPPTLQTEWHPTEPVGRFSTLTRGAFPTFEGAVTWAAAKLGGTPYAVTFVAPDAGGPSTPEHLNGARVTRHGNTVFVPLPRAAWRESHGCCCPYCSTDASKGAEVNYWDTLAIVQDPAKCKPGNGNPDHTWLVHYPELHGVSPKR